MKDCTYELRIRELEYDSTARGQQQQMVERPCDAEIRNLKDNSMSITTLKVVNAIKEGVGQAERDFQKRTDITEVNFDEIYESAKGSELRTNRQNIQQQAHQRHYPQQQEQQYYLNRYSQQKEDKRPQRQRGL